MGLLETTVHLNPVVILLRQTATEILGQIDRSTSFSVFDWDQLVKIGHRCCKERIKIGKLSCPSPPPPAPFPLIQKGLIRRQQTYDT